MYVPNAWYVAAWISVSLALLAGSAAAQVIQPEPKTEALPTSAQRMLHVGLYYSPQFVRMEQSRFVFSRKASVPIGEASAKFLEEVFARAFQKTTRLSGLSPAELAASGVDVAIAPSIEHFDFKVVGDTDSDRFSIHYRMTVHDSRGIPLLSWVVAGNKPSRSNSLEEQIGEHMLDAGTKLLHGFDAQLAPVLGSNPKDRGRPGTLDTGGVALTGTRARPDGLDAKQAAALADAGVVALRITARNQGEQPLTLRASDMRLRLKDRQPLEPVGASFVLSALASQSNSGDAAALLLGPIVGLLTATAEMQAGHAARASQFQTTAGSLFGTRTLARGKEESGVVLFHASGASGSLDGAVLTLWLVNPAAGEGAQTEISFSREADQVDCDFGALAGRWEGTATTRGGQRFAATLLFREDGTWDNYITGVFNPGPKFTGMTTGVAGTCRWRSHTTGGVGVFVMEGSGAERELVMRPEGGRVEVRLKAARAAK